MADVGILALKPAFDSLFWSVARGAVRLALGYILLYRELSIIFSESIQSASLQGVALECTILFGNVRDHLNITIKNKTPLTISGTLVLYLNKENTAVLKSEQREANLSNLRTTTTTTCT